MPRFTFIISAIKLRVESTLQFTVHPRSLTTGRPTDRLPRTHTLSGLVDGGREGGAEELEFIENKNSISHTFRNWTPNRGSQLQREFSWPPPLPPEGQSIPAVGN